MTIRKHIFQTALGLAVISGFSACDALDDTCPLMNDNSASGDSLHIRLTIDTRGQNTRADNDRPNGGEKGDGWEFGTDDENRIHDVCIFAYRGKAITELTAQEAGNITILASGYANADAQTDQTGTEAGHTEYKGDDPAIVTADFAFYKGEKMTINDLQFIVVANVGDITEEVGSRVKDIFDYQTYSSWTVNNQGKPTKFAMSSTTNSYTLGGKGTKDDPINYHIDIERTAARIDFDFAGATFDAESSSLDYVVKNAAGTLKIADFYLTHVKIVNGCVLPSYMLKRVAKDVNGTSGFQYLGDETFSKDGTATNYVIDPRTALRSGSFDQSWPDSWYAGTTMYASLAETYADDAPIGTTQQFKSHIDWAATITTVNGYTIGYVNENTFDKDQTVSAYATGLQLKGIYVPAKIYKAYHAEEGELTESTTYQKGDDFWRVLCTDDPAEEKCLYFDNENAAKDYCDYYNKVFKDEDGNTVVEGHSGIASYTKYTNGLCYYYVWLRHANNGDDGVHGPMEFGIVRNNIYRVQVSKISGPGTVKPDPRNPEYLKAIIYVRKWREVTHPVIPV